MTDDVDPRDDSTDSTTEAVRFGLDGIVHEIDLDPAEARALRAALAPLVADRHDRHGRAPAGRAWLEANGHKLGPGGRISATLMTLYRGRDGR